MVCYKKYMTTINVLDIPVPKTSNKKKKKSLGDIQCEEDFNVVSESVEERRKEDTTDWPLLLKNSTDKNKNI
ncbi:UNVERIFIED_CONTAM: hypothetical protein NCL1_49310 [Trichonephila clavipes]